jgi:tetratricopeptide (TPR) repeat protein
MAYRKSIFTAATFIVLILSACDPTMLPMGVELDTPFNHVTNGMRLLNVDKIDDADREFLRAKELDPMFSPAYVGLGLVCGYRGDFEKGLEMMEKADEHAGENEQKAGVRVGYMRLYIMGGEPFDKDWLARVEREFEKAAQASPDLPDAYYYMGVAYRKSGDPDKAAHQFRKVILIGEEYTEEAERENTIIFKQRNTPPGSKSGG